MSDVQGLVEVNSKLNRLLELGKLSPQVNAEIGNVLLAEMQENFRVGGRPSPWQPSLRVKAFGGETLRQTGRLMRSLNVHSENNGVTIGSNLIYARIHALGGVIKAKTSEGLRFRLPAGLTSTSKTGKALKRPQKRYVFVRTQQVTIPRRDYRYISPRAFEYVVAIAGRHLVVG